jgi:hypothetical protein
MSIRLHGKSGDRSVQGGVERLTAEDGLQGNQECYALLAQ